MARIGCEPIRWVSWEPARGLLRKYRYTKTRLVAHGGVVHSRNSYGYRFGSRRARHHNPSFSSDPLIYQADG